MKQMRLSDFIGQHVALVSMGGKLFGCCPFHGGEQTPSMMVDDQKGRWRCFSCTKGGDVAAFADELGVNLMEETKERAWKEFDGDDNAWDGFDHGWESRKAEWSRLVQLKMDELRKGYGWQREHAGALKTYVAAIEEELDA